MAAYREKSGVYKVKQGGILKPALLCRDYPTYPTLTMVLGSNKMELVKDVHYVQFKKKFKRYYDNNTF